MKPSKYTIASVLLLLGAFSLFFFRIGHHSFWGDELQTAEITAHRSQAELWNPSNPVPIEEHFAFGFLAPYYSASRLWCSLFGSSEAGLRSLSAAGAWAALAMILIMGPSLGGISRRASFVAGALFALSPMMLWYAQEARYYAFLQPIILISCWFYLEFWRSGRGGWLAGWSAISIFAIMTHPFMIFEIAAQSCYGLWLWWRKGFIRWWVVVLGHGLVASGFLFMLKPLLIIQEDSPPYSKATDELMPWKALSNFLCGIYEHPFPFLALLLVATAVVTLVPHICEEGRLVGPGDDRQQNNRGIPEGKGDPMFWIVVSIGACFLMIAVSMYRPIMVEGKKYVMIFFAPFCVCLGNALTRFSLSRVLPALFLGVMTLNSFLTDWKYFTEPQKQNWRLAGQIIRQNSRPGDIWLHQNVWRGFASEYYGGGTSRVVKDVVWKPPSLKEDPPPALRMAQRVWLVKTGGIADVYGARLEEAGFRRAVERALPTGTHFMTHLWLYEKASP